MKNRSAADRAALFLATGFYSGYSPVAPGTAGSAVGVAIFWFIQPLPWWAYLTITAVIFAVGVAVSARAEGIFGQKDAKFIVIDEMAGQLITLFLAPKTVTAVVGGFLLFRLFDIWKFWPMSAMERYEGGWGVMMDDVAAGVLGLAFLQIVLRFA